MKKAVLFMLLAAAIASIFMVIPSVLARAGGAEIALVGDILLDRGVGRAISDKGMDYPWLKVGGILKQADIAFGNLECPLTRAEAGGILKNRNLIFKGDPENAKELKQAGFDVLNLANNHTMDYGPQGLEDTLKTLGETGIAALGGGMNPEEAAGPVFFKKAGMTIGFLGLSAFPPEGYFFSDEKPDVARAGGVKTVEAIEKAKKQCDFLIVSFHWGKEFDHYPGAEQKAMARSAVDHGADLVIGHHPHVLQGVEEYGGHLIFYSLGNFVFDRQIPEGTDETVVLVVAVAGGQLKKAEIVPVKIGECQPYPAAGEDAEHILDRLRLFSGKFGANFVMKGDSAEYVVGNPAN